MLKRLLSKSKVLETLRLLDATSEEKLPAPVAGWRMEAGVWGAGGVIVHSPVLKTPPSVSMVTGSTPRWQHTPRGTQRFLFNRY